MDLTQILTGAGVVIGVPLLIYIFNAFRLREKTVTAGIKIGKLIKKTVMAFDIPVISGKFENTVKERFLTTWTDLLIGVIVGGLKINYKKFEVFLSDKSNYDD